jgi:glutamate dehydrogenase (NADP+)
MESTVDMEACLLASIEKANPGEKEYIQAVKEFLRTILPFYQSNERYQGKALLERLMEPERTIMFRVVWTDDNNIVHVNKGYRIEFNSAIGPFKGGLRFHPTVNLSILKFLGFEQTLKNALTGLAIGGAKGGSDFDTKGKSENEVMRFCQSFMLELQRHIGANTDVPAGDIGVGHREIGYLFGQYKRVKNEFEGILTGKKLGWGGLCMRTEATGFGVVYFCQSMLMEQKDTMEGKSVIISGSGNVATFAAMKCIEFGAKVITLSDSDGYIYDANGITKERMTWILDLKNNRRGRIEEYAKMFGKEGKGGVVYVPGGKPWAAGFTFQCSVDITLPCATQNEIGLADAKTLVDSGCMCVCEGANMPCSLEAVACFQATKGVLFAPGKASNAAGVACSALEMAQNKQGIKMSCQEADLKIQDIMKRIHNTCVKYGTSGGHSIGAGTVDYVHGSNIAGFITVADAMLDQGYV